MEKDKKLKLTQKTPSKSEYFSWINNTMEGSTEAHTLINLNFFNYLNKKYGLKLDIYAWDAGNLDGAVSGYEKSDSKKIKNQFPNGYAPLVEKAKLMGTRMGIWCGPDGYGNTNEELQERRNLLVNLCKDLNFALLKMDGVCGKLREDKQVEFEKTIKQCLKYSKDLIVLQHFHYGIPQKYALPFFWVGEETYIDVHAFNKITAPHNRAYTFFKGHSPNLDRLGEDHGVCLSSCLDFFEDELIYQAFNHNLILAPEIYANPWLLRDDEFSKLARIFNLHRKYRDILVSGIIPKNDYGNDAVIRGDKNRRFLSTGNGSWSDKEITVTLNEEIGLKKCKKIVVLYHFPTCKYVGTFNYGESVKLNLQSFRATLIEFYNAKVADAIPIGCEYEVLHETNGKIDEINLLKCDGTVEIYSPKTNEILNVYTVNPLDITPQSPKHLETLENIPLPTNAEELYENACFKLDNDSLEKRSLIRSGDTEIKEVKDARDAFFNQKSYLLRGLDGTIPFDNNPNTIYDGKSRVFGDNCRINGGCLRVDFGDVFYADRIEIEYFEANKKDNINFFNQEIKDNAETSLDLSTFDKAPLEMVETVKNQTQPYYSFGDDVYREIDGLRKKVTYLITNKKVRYLRIPNPIDRIYTIKLYNGRSEVRLTNAKANNLFAPYKFKQTKNVSSIKLNLNDLPLNPYLAVACEGITGNENVTVIAKIDNEYHAFPSRAPSYPCNPFESVVCKTQGYYTFYLPILKNWKDKEIEIITLFADNSVKTDVYLCDANSKRQGVTLKL